jgi:hypothetical protein
MRLKLKLNLVLKNMKGLEEEDALSGPRLV